MFGCCIFPCQLIPACTPTKASVRNLHTTPLVHYAMQLKLATLECRLLGAYTLCTLCCPQANCLASTGAPYISGNCCIHTHYTVLRNQLQYSLPQYMHVHCTSRLDKDGAFLLTTFRGEISKADRTCCTTMYLRCQSTGRPWEAVLLGLRHPLVAGEEDYHPPVRLWASRSPSLPFSGSNVYDHKRYHSLFRVSDMGNSPFAMKGRHCYTGLVLAECCEYNFHYAVDRTQLKWLLTKNDCTSATIHSWFEKETTEVS